MPSILISADSEMRSRASEIMNKAIVEEYSSKFKYSDIVNIEKDKEGNIILLQADTIKLTKIACDVADRAHKDLKEVGQVGGKINLGYVLKNNLLAQLGPQVTYKMEPIGYIETEYVSSFVSAGINQTTHKMSVVLKTKLRITIPLAVSDIEIKTEVPISETVIIGKVPTNSFQLK